MKEKVLIDFQHVWDKKKIYPVMSRSYSLICASKHVLFSWMLRAKQLFPIQHPDASF